MARWPSIGDYELALLDSGTLKDERLRSMKLVRDALGKPRMLLGNSGLVCHFEGSEALALKMFRQDLSGSDLPRRQEAIGGYLAEGRPRCLLELQYLEEGVFVHDRWFPAVVMEWSVGRPLDAYVGAHFRHGATDCTSLARAWIGTLEDLRHAKVLHGDLQHGNVIVDDHETIRLVDYDGMVVPGLDLPQLELGHVDYQHPLRLNGSHTTLDPVTEDFSALVILVSLATLTPDLWQRHQVQEGLILNRADLEQPDASQTLAELSRSGGMATDLCELLRGAIGDLSCATQALEEAAVLVGRPLPRRPDLDAADAEVSFPPSAERHLLLPGGNWQQAAAVSDGIQRGKSDAAIALEMGIGDEQVRRILANLQVHLGVSSRDAIPAAVGRLDLDGGLSHKEAAPPTMEHRGSGQALTSMQLEILRMLSRGWTRREIAVRLDCAVGTVGRNIRLIRVLLEASSDQEAVLRAGSMGLPVTTGGEGRGPRLSADQLVVLESFRRGENLDAARTACGLSESTFAMHLQDIRDTLFVASNDEAVALAQRLRYLQPVVPQPAAPKGPTGRQRTPQAAGKSERVPARTAAHRSATPRNPLHTPPAKPPSVRPVAPPRSSLSSGMAALWWVAFILVLVLILWFLMW